MSTKIDIEIKAKADQATREIKQMSRDIDSSLDGVKDSTKEMSKDIDRSLDDVKDSTKEVSKETEKMEKTVDQSSRDITDNYDKLAKKTDEVEKKHDSLYKSSKNLVTGFSGVATAGMGLYNTYDRVQDAQLGVDRANLKVKTSANMVEDATRRQTNAGVDLEKAQNKLSEAIEKYGADSDEAAKATETVNQKLSAYQAASDDAKLAAERYDLAVQTAKQTQDNYSDTMTNAAVSVIPQVITMTDSLAKSYNALKDIDFSGLINKFIGKDGITDSLGSTGGVVEGLKTKLGGLNGISFSGLVGGLAGVAAAAYSAYYAIQQTKAEQATYELQHAGKQMSTAETVATGAKNFVTAIPNTVADQLLGLFGVSKPSSEQQAVMNWYQAGKITKTETEAAFNTGDYTSTILLGQYRAGDISLAEFTKKQAAASLALAQKVKGYASGFEGVTNGPTMFIAGEGSEQEHVSITPMSRTIQGGGVSVNAKIDNQFHIASVSGSENLPAILKAITRAVRSGDDQGLTDALNRTLAEQRRRG